MTTTTTGTGTCDPRVELGRYLAEEGERVLVGRRIDGEVFVTYYRRCAAELGVCPMSPAGVARSLGDAA
ncbi:MAG TPA: hypothetical protein VHA80_01655 [Solirubrobacterales bacterium]|jgi:hypothetical protein|nr:hypothetical protein [Solirubrobacterales bacterium]